jgi:hypothetical protein
MGRKGGVRKSKSRVATSIPLRRVPLLKGWRCVPFQMAVSARTGRGCAGFDPPCAHPYFWVIPSRRRTSKKDTPAKLAKRMSRRWRVVLLRHKGEILGAEAAKAAAVVQFELDETRRSRIIVQELA